MPSTMRSVRLHPAPEGTPAYTPSNPAPTTALHLDTIPTPQPSAPGELLVKVQSTTIVRDTLTWPELYTRDYFTPGNDVSGTVVEVFSPDSKFSVGDEVYGMTGAERCGTWAEYAIALESEVAIKPKGFSWEEAAAVPLSGMTALEAFLHAGVEFPSDGDVKKVEGNAAKRVLVTGAGGAVGVYVVQLGNILGLHVTAATSSNERNAEFLKGLGADETIEYSSLTTEAHKDVYDIIIDTIGGQPLVDSWGCVKSGGVLVTVDSSSFGFVEEHKKSGIAKDGVKALFFIVEGGSKHLDILAQLADQGLLQVFVLDSYPMEKVWEAYERANGRLTGRGKILLSV
ncbi:hypothetical protein BJY04DRAFT_185002 [Aspergillus karnatakaensis]|uniref:NADP-dependent oxidoreductase n=1 Tax=Aspergillus karnatakaensis TaxID=1810916 RepID=UPI003CCDE4F5